MQTKRKRISILFVLILTLCFVTSCASTPSAPSSGASVGSASSPASDSAPAESEGSTANKPDYPKKPVELVVPYGAGGAHDMYSRGVASVLPKYLGMPVNVNLINGGSGTIGSDYAAKAKPDGYTIMLTGTSPAIALLHTRDDLTYGLDSFDYICYINGSYSIIEVPVDSPFNSLEELFAYAREHPGELRYASSGVYSASHITTECIADDLGLEFVHVPYDSGGASSTAVVSGEVDFGMLGITASRQLVEGGMLKAFAITTPERDEGTLKDVPTMKELGYDGTYYVNSRFLMAPKGVPEEILKYIIEACRQMSEDPQFIDYVENMGETVEYMDGEAYLKWIDDNYKALEPTMKRLAAKQD